MLILLMGMSWAGAGLYLSNVKISLVNFVGVPIMMGIGIDVIIIYCIEYQKKAGTN